MRYYIIAGEASGDLHGSNLMQALQEKDRESEFRFWGGDRMQSVGGTLVKHYRDLAFMGFLEVLLNLRTILKNIKFCKQDLTNYKPDALILIDYPGFNMRIAEFAKAKGISVHYYIAPQAWAWKEGRVKKIKRIVDALYVILPFEKDFFEVKHGLPVHFVGHPLLDEIKKPVLKAISPILNDLVSDKKTIVALLPGSRRQEIKKMLSVMLSMVSYCPNHQFVVAGLRVHGDDFYRSFLSEHLPNVTVVYGETHNLLRHATAALVASGTASLETALFGVPSVVCYRGSWFSYQIGKWLVKVKFIALANLIMNRMIVRELIQNEFNTKNLKKYLSLLLEDKNYIEQMKQDYQLLFKKLGGAGASQRVADLMMSKNKTATDANRASH